MPLPCTSAAVPRLARSTSGHTCMEACARMRAHARSSVPVLRNRSPTQAILADGDQGLHLDTQRQAPIEWHSGPAAFRMPGKQKAGCRGGKIHLGTIEQLRLSRRARCAEPEADIGLRWPAVDKDLRRGATIPPPKRTVCARGKDRGCKAMRGKTQLGMARHATIMALRGGADCAGAHKSP